MKEQSPQSLSSIFFDIIFPFCIVVFSMFLIGYYTRYNFLDTGYQDWFFHAFRIQSLDRHGIVSWDHIWSNGINYWQGYQYIPHLLALGIAKLFHISIPQAMMWLTVIVFVFIRITIYGVLRLLQVAPLFAFVATMSSFATAQEWNAIKDFSLYLALLPLPFYVLLWIQSMKQKSSIYFFSVLAGIGWLFHFTLGYTLFGLLVFAAIFSAAKLTKKEAAIAFGLFFLSSAPFFIPYFFSGYKFVNPVLSSAQFLRDVVVGKYMGLSLVLVLIFAFNWIVTFIKTSSIDRWPRLLLLFCTLYIAAIFLAQNGYLPGFIRQLQISRGIIYIGMMIPYIFGVVLQVSLKNLQSRFIYTVLVVCMAIISTEAIDLSSQFTSDAVHVVENPVANYFKNKNAKGSIFTESVADASFFAKDGLRYVTSYNEHAEPHPLAQRFKRLLKSDFAFTGLSKKQLRLINQYSHVLGVEYLFIPDFAPLAKNTNITSSEDLDFELVDEVTTKKESFAVLKNKREIYYAYVGDISAKKDIHFENLKQPTLHAASFEPWDKEVEHIYALIEKGTLKPVPVEFINTNELKIDLSSVEDKKNKFLFVAQSHNSNWHATNANVTIKPTSLRLMYIELPADFQQSQLSLVNTWPVWYWPVQSLGLVSLVGLLIYQYGIVPLKKK